MKVAGTSIEAMLSRECDDDDLLTGPGIHKDLRDDTGDIFETYRSRNNIDQSNGLSRFHPHSSPDILYNKTGDSWGEYTKISAVRNPWDMCVSYWWWSIFSGKSWGGKDIVPNKDDSRIDLIRKFRIFLFTLGSFSDTAWGDSDGLISSLDWLSWASKKFYTDDIDFTIRYERLEEDCRHICNLIGVKFDSVPRFKTNLRKLSTHYSEYYDPVTIKLVEERFSPIIKKFGYKFENG